jgi:hypothetical protein
MNLRPVSFKMKTGGDTNYGFIAQEVQDVIPDAVSTLPGGYLGVAEGKFIPYLVGAVKEQQTQLSSLDSLVSGTTGILRSAQNDITSLNLQTSQNITTVSELQKSVDEQLTVINKDFTNTDKILKQVQDDIAGANDKTISLDSQISILNAKYQLLDTLQSQMDDIKAENKAILDFFTVLNPETMVLKDALGNVDLLKGKLTAQDIEALGTVKAKDIEAENSVKGKTLTGENLELGKETRAAAKLKAGDTEIEIETPQTSKDIQVYITPLDKLSGRDLYVDMSDVKDGQSFKVKLDGDPLSKDIQFNWLLIQ